MIEYMKRVSCWWISFVCLLCFAFTTQIDSRECCVWFQCFTQWCCTCVSNPVRYLYREKWKSELLMDVFCVSLFCLHHSNWIVWVLCLISMTHSMIFLQLLQFSSLLKKKESELLMCVFCVYFCLHISDRVQWLLCLISMLHSMMLLPYIQFCSLLKKENVRVFCWLLPFACLVCSQLISTFMSVAFDFKDSLNDVTPVSSILLPVDNVSM